MDRLSHYKSIIKQFFTEYSALLTAPPEPELDVIVALDDERGHYLLLKAGWKDNRYIRHFILHVAIHNDKIWIEEDWTEKGIATYFLEQGIPHQDIVLGFQPPQMRPYTEFAAA